MTGWSCQKRGTKTVSQIVLSSTGGGLMVVGLIGMVECVMCAASHRAECAPAHLGRLLTAAD